MLTLRLQRVGRKHDPSYRIVATDSRTGPKSNKHVAILGHHDAIRKVTQIKDSDAIQRHIANGAQVTDTLYNILIKQGVITGTTVNPLPKKTPIASEQQEETPAPAAAAEEVAETPAEEVAETPTEEAAAEETPAEEVAETPTEEPATEETPAEEAADTPTEEPATEETPAEEAADTPAEEPTAEAAEETTEKEA